MVASKVSTVFHRVAPVCLLFLAIAAIATWIGLLGYAAFMLAERLIGMGLAIAGS
jgi:hypothetical protein